MRLCGGITSDAEEIGGSLAFSRLRLNGRSENGIHHFILLGSATGATYLLLIGIVRHTKHIVEIDMPLVQQRRSPNPFMPCMRLCTTHCKNIGLARQDLGRKEGDCDSAG